MTMTVSGPTDTAAPEERRARRRIAHLLALVGILSLSVWWIAWVTSESILSEARSADIGSALVDDEVVQGEVSSQVLEGLRLAGVQALGFTDADLIAASEVVARDPAVEADIAERVADAHRASLDVPSVSDISPTFGDQPFVDASMRALQEERPDIAIPNLQWLFTTSVSGGFPDLTGPAEAVEGFRTPALILAVAGFLGSAIVYPDRRPRRWLARWCLVAGGATLVLPVLLPMLTTSVGGDTGSTIRALSAAVGGGTPQRGAVLLLLIGGLLSFGTWAHRQRLQQTATAAATVTMPTTTEPGPPAVEEPVFEEPVFVEPAIDEPAVPVSEPEPIVRPTMPPPPTPMPSPVSPPPAAEAPLPHRRPTTVHRPLPVRPPLPQRRPVQEPPRRDAAQ